MNANIGTDIRDLSAAAILLGRSDSAWRIARFTAVALATGALMMPLFAYAGPTPKPSPSPSASLCFNKITGVMRDILSNESAGCHKTEIAVSLDTLLALQPAPAPSAGPTDSATPEPSSTPGPVSGAAPIVVDATGKVVGPVMGTTYGGQANLVELKASGMPIEVLVSDIGFVDEATTGGYNAFTEYFASGDCSGQPMVGVGHTLDARNDEGRPLIANPLIEVPEQVSVVNVITGPYVYNQIVYFAVPPFNDAFAPGSAETFSFDNDPSVSNSGLCVAETAALRAVGPLATLNLNSLNLTPPFHLQ